MNWTMVELKGHTMAGKMMDGELGMELASEAAAPGAQWPVAPHELRRLRIRKRESQEKFWSRFGVTQSSGSRFETGVMIPPPVAILLRLYMNGMLSDDDLHG
jgi:DNA-binding transcriptional regulator YiaG